MANFQLSKVLLTECNIYCYFFNSLLTLRPYQKMQLKLRFLRSHIALLERKLILVILECMCEICCPGSPCSQGYLRGPICYIYLLFYIGFFMPIMVL